MKKIRTAALVLASAGVIVHIPATGQEIPSETWMGIYLGNSKIGYARFAINQAVFRGKEAYRLESSSATKIVTLGVSTEQTIDTTVYLDSGFSPVYQIFKMSSKGHTATVTATFTKKEIIAESNAGGNKNTKKIPIPPGSKVVADDTFHPGTINLKVGDEMDLKFFNPLTFTLDDLHMKVLREETLDIGGRPHNAFVIESLTPMGKITCWQDSKGNILKVIAIMGITMVRESKEEAQSLTSQTGEYAPPSDLAVMTSAPTTTIIPDPRKVKRMRVRLTGLKEKSFVINDERQTVTYSDGENPSAEYTIIGSELDLDKSVKLPITAKEMKEFLSDSLYIQPSDEEIAKTAKEIAGDEKRAAVLIYRLRSWVHTNIKSRGDIGIVRSSVDILRAKEGVCRDYAVLYTAMARAIGIPTKLVAGLIFWKDGFYYHAWAESFAGRWVPIDPTLPTDFVDATHIKLTEGDTTAMFEIVRTMGSLKAEILEFEELSEN